MVLRRSRGKKESGGDDVIIFSLRKYFGEPNSQAGLPCPTLLQREELGPASTCQFFVDSHEWRWRKSEWGEGRKEVGRENWRGGARGNCGGVCKVNDK